MAPHAPRSPAPPTLAAPEAPAIVARVVALEEIHADPENPNLGTPAGTQKLALSLATTGLGRSILADRDLTTLAGNHVLAAAKKAGVKKAIVVDSAPDTLVVVRRPDLSLAADPAPARKAAILDNVSAREGIELDLPLIRRQAKKYRFAPEEVGISAEELGEVEKKAIAEAAPAAGGELPPTPAETAAIGAPAAPVRMPTAPAPAYAEDRPRGVAQISHQDPTPAPHTCGVLVYCNSLEEQDRVYRELSRQGYKARPVEA